MAVIPKSESLKTEENLRRALITFAAVSDALSTSNDFLQGIAPIFSTIADARNGQLFNEDVFSDDVKSLFGLLIPPDVAHFMAPRLAKAGLLKRRQTPTDGELYFWTGTEVDEKKYSMIALDLDKILEQFKNFCFTFPSLFSRTYEQEELEEILFDFLVSRDANLTAAQAALSEGHVSNPNSAMREQDYICARFLQKLEKDFPSLFDLVGQIANAAILSEVVIDLGQGDRSNHVKADVAVYMDAPLVMDVLGLSGPESAEYAKSIVSGLLQLSAKLYIFDHSVEEIRDILYGVLNSHPHNRTGPTADAMRAGSVDEAFVAYVMHNVEEAVREAGIPIVARPMDGLSMQQKSYISEGNLQTLYEMLYAAYEKPKALDRDVLSLRIVISRRLGSSTTNFLKSKHLMLTRNSLLRIQSKLFMEREKAVPLHRVPPAEHISRIAASLWLELGAPEKLSISRKQLVAACSRVAEARPEIIEKLHAALQRIVPEKAAQFETLISQPRMMRLAVDVMGGVERHITDKTALEAFDRLQEELTSDAEKKAKLDERRLRERHREQLKAKETELVDLADRLSQETQRRRASAEYSANARMRNIRRAGYVASGVIAILGVGGALVFVDNAVAKYALAAAAAAFSVACYYGLSHQTLMQRVIARGGRRMDGRMRRAGLLAEGEFLELRDGKVVVVERRTDQLLLLPDASEVAKNRR